jgi:hypothetical protein
MLHKQIKNKPVSPLTPFPIAIGREPADFQLSPLGARDRKAENLQRK